MRPRGRVAVGWIAIAVGVLGILDLAHGDPTAAAARRGAGGLLGVLAGSPLGTALTAYLAIPILALVAIFGLLVVTGTPLHAVPDRLRAIGRKPVPEGPELEDGVEPTEPIKRGRAARRQAAAGEDQRRRAVRGLAGAAEDAPEAPRGDHPAGRGDDRRCRRRSSSSGSATAAMSCLR